jgi:hypothetical protein
MPRPPGKVKLVVSAIYSNNKQWNFCRKRIEESFSSEDYQGLERAFNHTDYYCEEMDSPLNRQFVSYERLISPEELVEIKLFTNQLEKESGEQQKRRVNLDPGYLALGNFVLATTKHAAHRIYLGKGIYADLALIYEKGTYRSLPWTYPDYGSREIIEMMNKLRQNLKAQLRSEQEVA